MHVYFITTSKLFRYTWLNKLYLHSIFYVVCNGKTKKHRRIRRSVVFLMFQYFGVPVFHGVPWCSGVPGFSEQSHIMKENKR